MGRESKGVDDLMAFGKQFWDSWSAFAQGIQPGQTPSWGAPADAFGQFAAGLPGEARHAVESLSEQGRQFFQFMQDAAGRMGAGDGLGVADVAALWRRSMADGNPALDALRAASSEGARGFEQMGKDLAGLMAPFRQEWSAWLQQPAFGYSREKQEALQALMKAAQDHAEANQAYNALLLKASQRGAEYFENKLAERSEPGRQIDSARALYDLWVDAAEEAYAEIALSPEFRVAYGNLVNTQMRLRQGLQKQAEAQAASLGLPTRSELDGTHQKLKQMRQEARELRARLGRLEALVGAGDAAVPAAAEKPAVARKPAVKKASRARAPLVDQTDVAETKAPSARSKKGGK